MTFASQPSGLSISVNGSSVVTRYTVASAEGFTLSAVAPLSQTSGPNLYLFSNWDGVFSNLVTVVTPAAPATHTANYQLSLTVGPLPFYSLAPCRVADTRNPIGASGGPALAANTTRTFPVTGICSVPATAKAVAINVTVVDETDGGDLRLYPTGSFIPGSSTINFTTGKVRANNAVVPLGPDGKIAVQCDMPLGSLGRTHFLFDVTGYFQ